MTGPDYFQAMDYPTIVQAYPVGDDFVALGQRLSRDELFARQDAQFRKCLDFAWKVPFYQRLWGDKGIEPGDIRGLADIGRLPTYSKTELMASVAAHPPMGDFHGLDSYPAGQRPPVVFQTTSGTTGKPQPLIYGAKSREVQNRLLARAYLWQGMRREDVVHSVYGHGLINGGHYVREAVSHWVGARFMSAGTGIETRSVNQVMMMREFGATVLVGFGDYVKRLADVARAEGMEPGRDIRIRMITGHIGAESRETMSQAWGGAEVYDWYGVGDTGIIAGQGPDQDGMYVMEDAQYLELLDPDTGLPVEDGALGDMVCTCLFKDDVFPIIRFNTHDVTEVMTGASSTGVNFRRIRGFMGRSDNMVKLRGINIFPTGIGALLSEEREEMTGEYICRVDRIDGRDEMTVHVEVRAGAEDAAMKAAYEKILRTRLGVEIGVAFAAPGELAPLTGIEVRQKPIRLIDERK
ncbi:phenylacetate--CoA ligase family protein (plasmid) [Tistrella mobilis]|uniref:CoF synthetase n=1 Tax=Tistrella mobilis TaxID=171437 RepID=A0A162LGP5_9PROT|nr:phenylacetate--CoA ligase family protein [Tistrella mobilis]KYO54910.1 CoF synthetase [Tistrella mobilis]